MKVLKKIICGFLLAPCIVFNFGQNPVQIEAAGSWWNNADATTKACTYLVQNLGYTRFAAAGILGNFRHESNVNPYVRERIGNHDTYSLGKEKADKLDPDNNGFGPGWGLAQWGDGSGYGGLGSSRWVELLNYTNARKGTRYSAAYNDSFRYGVSSNQESVRANIPGLYEQLDFVKYEMRSGSGYVSQVELNSMTTIDETADAVLYRYEKSSTRTRDVRREKAHDIYQYNCNSTSGYDYTVPSAGCIDELSIVADKLKVRGWHATAGANERSLRYIFFMDANTGNEIKRAPLTNVIREDVASVYPYLSTSRTSGFNIEVPLTDVMRGKKIFVVTRYLPGTNPNETISDSWFRENQIVVPPAPTPPLTPPAPSKVPSVIYQANIQKLGWQAPAKDMSLSGTVGKNLGIETLRLSLINLPVAGGISYQTYTPKTGWQTPTSNNQIAGTIGQNTSIETVNIRLTGEIANQYDVYYRVYSRKYGWLGFAKNGGNAGSVGRGSQIDGLQVVILKKGSKVETKNAFIDQTGKFVS